MFGEQIKQWFGGFISGKPTVKEFRERKSVYIVRQVEISFRIHACLRSHKINLYN